MVAAARETLDSVAILVGMVAVAITGLLVWKTKAAQVWKDVAEGREQKLEDQSREISELREDIAGLKATIAYLERRQDEVVLAAIQALDQTVQSNETRAQARHDAEVKLLGRMATALEQRPQETPQP